MPHDVHEVPGSSTNSKENSKMPFISSSLGTLTMGGMRLLSNCIPMHKLMGSWSWLIQMSTSKCAPSMSNHPHLSHPQPYICLKCTFSQTKSNVKWKLMGYVISFPKTIVVVKVVVKELPLSYCSPIITQNLWNSSPAGTSSHGKSENTPEMLQMHLGPWSPRITWINILVIEVHIWVQTGQNPIDVTFTSTWWPMHKSMYTLSMMTISHTY